MAKGVADICICVLFYGAEDRHLKLAQRVLNEPMRCLAERNIEFRFGCNAVGPATSGFLQRQIADTFQDALLFSSAANILKYPMMREMFYAPPISAPMTMWFDHDSYIEPDSDVDAWLDRIKKHLVGCCDMIGSVQKSKLSTEQAEWAAAQDWFDSARDRQYLDYAIGSWWVVKTDVLYRYDWPATDLRQKEGDLMFGTLFKHQGLSLCHFREGVKINANDAGVEAAVPRTI